MSVSHIFCCWVEPSLLLSSLYKTVASTLLGYFCLVWMEMLWASKCGASLCTSMCSDVSWPNSCFVYTATKSTLLFPWPPPGQALPNPLVGMLQRSTGGGGWHLPTKTEDQCNIFKMSPAWIFIVPDSVWIEVVTFLLFGRAVSLQAIRDTLAESRVHFADR